MEKYQCRDVDEERELSQKIMKLNNFTMLDKNREVFNGLPIKDRNLLTEQLRLMKEYIEVLRERIERFKG